MSFEEILLVLGMALVTFATRYPILAYVSRIELPAPLLTALKFIPPALLTAIILPLLVAPNGEELHLTYTNVYLVAGLVTLLVAWRTKNLLLTLGIGMLAFWGWRALLPWLDIV